MKYEKCVIYFLLLNLLFVSCGEDPKYKEFFPGSKGEKPKEFIYAFSKNYVITPEENSVFIENIRVFAKKHYMAEYGSEKLEENNFNIYFVAGPPMKYLLRVEGLSESLYRVKISCHPQRVCKLCEEFILEIDSKFQLSES